MKINLNKCRVCFENIGVIPFFQEHEDEIVSEMISSLFNIDVIYDENLPTTICTNCLENIKLCFLTKTIIVNSESMLRIYLKSNITVGESAENLNQIKVEDEDPIIKSDMFELDTEDIQFGRNGCSSQDFEDKQSAGFQIINVQSLTSSNPQTTPIVTSDLYDCEFCEFRAVTYKRLNSHRRIHPEAVRVKEQKHYKEGKHSPDKSKPKRVTCKFCGRKLSIYSIQRHIRFIHFGEKPFSCSYCHKSFSRSDNLTSHMQVHFNSKDNFVVDPQKKQFYLKHKCDECDKAFANPTLLKLHKVVHTRVGAHVCPHCGQTFNLKVILKRHIRLFHITDDDPKNLTCKSCGNVSANLAELKFHFSTHTDHKPFQCNFCDVRFVYGKSLRKHIARKHFEAQNDGKKRGQGNKVV